MKRYPVDKCWNCIDFIRIRLVTHFVFLALGVPFSQLSADILTVKAVCLVSVLETHSLTQVNSELVKAGQINTSDVPEAWRQIRPEVVLNLDKVHLILPVIFDNITSSSHNFSVAILDEISSKEFEFYLLSVWV